MRLLAAVLTAWLFAMPASGATIYTFAVSGTSDFDTSTIQSYAFTLAGAGGSFTFTKDIDAASDDILQAVAQGSVQASATFVAYDGVISPQTELFRYLLTDVLFTSSSLDQTGETVTLQAATVTFVQAATVFTFSVGGTTDFDTDTIHSYFFVADGAGGALTFTKDVDATSPDILLATALGTVFPSATFIAYDGPVSPEAEVFRYVLSNILFTAVSVDQLPTGATPTETVTMQAQTATFQQGPASVPEPVTGVMVLAGVAVIMYRRARGPHESL